MNESAMSAKKATHFGLDRALKVGSQAGCEAGRSMNFAILSNTS